LKVEVRRTATDGMGNWGSKPHIFRDVPEKTADLHPPYSTGKDIDTHIYKPKRSGNGALGQCRGECIAAECIGEEPDDASGASGGPWVP